MKEQVKALLNADLLHLRTQFQDHGFDIRLVGGCVRDMLAGIVPNDIDLCTSASPDEQLAVYQSAGVHYIDTGSKHGTYTVFMNGIGFEITSLRTESQHDGRHAVMAFTKDWKEDASRRDLTINSMALTFDGVLIDPFNGAGDLRENVVRFVGNSEERMTEDYLRIMRYFRFLGRFSDNMVAAKFIPGQSIYDCVCGLTTISAERIWAELKKIVAHPSAPWVMRLMEYHSVLDVLGLACPNDHFDKLKEQGCTDPVLLMASMLTKPVKKTDVEALAKRLKWSNQERSVALEITSYSKEPELDTLKMALALDNRDLGLTFKVCEFWGNQDQIVALQAWSIPVFPVTGDDLIAVGVKTGKELGKKLFTMKYEWYSNGATMTKEEMVSSMPKLLTVRLLDTNE